MTARVSSRIRPINRSIRSERIDSIAQCLHSGSRIQQQVVRIHPASSLACMAHGDAGRPLLLTWLRRRWMIIPTVVVVRFNPWLYGSEERQLRGFFDTLAAALGRSLPTKAEEIGNLLRDYGGLLLLASFSVAGVGLPNPSDALPRIGDSLAGVKLDELKQQIEEVLEQAGKRVRVLIDDIDRLERAEIRAIFKLVKLSASFTSTSYVFSFDDEMVASSLGERYAQAGHEA